MEEQQRVFRKLISLLVSREINYFIDPITDNIVVPAGVATIESQRVGSWQLDLVFVGRDKYTGRNIFSQRWKKYTDKEQPTLIEQKE
jgi:hypothetical protein